jgi:WD40 repeat protein
MLLVFWSLFLNTATVLACPPSTIVYAGEAVNEPADAVLKPGEVFTQRWLVRNDSTCDAIGYRLGFYSATLNSEDYTGSTFGGNTHPTVDIPAGETAWMEVSFAVPQEVGSYHVYVDVLDDTGVALNPLAKGRLNTTFKVAVVDSYMSLLHEGGRTNSINFSPDEKYVLTGSKENIILWDVVTGQEVRSFGSSGDVESCFTDSTLSPDGEYVFVLTCESSDNPAILKVFEIGTGQEIHSTGFSSSLLSKQVKLSPDGKFVLS